MLNYNKKNYNKNENENFSQLLYVYNNEKRFNIISLKNNLSDILELDNFDTFKYYIIFLENINNINKERKVSLIKIKKNFLKNYLN